MAKSSSRRTAVQNSIEFSREVRFLLEKTQPRTTLLTKLLWQTGITPKELVSLQKKDLHAQIKTLFLRSETTKNGISRTIKLTTELTNALEKIARGKTAKEYLFSTRQSTQLSTRRIEQLLKEASEKAKVNITARDLRNDYLAKAAIHAKNTTELKKLTGLKSISKDKLLSKQEQKRLAQVIKKQPFREQTLLKLLQETGMQLGEALSLKKISLQQQTINLPTRKITVTTSLIKLLKQITEQKKEYIFSTRQSTQLSIRRAAQLINEIGRKAEITNLTAQQIRATTLQEITTRKGIHEAKEQLGLQANTRYRHGIIETTRARKGGRDT